MRPDHGQSLLVFVIGCSNTSRARTGSSSLACVRELKQQMGIRAYIHMQSNISFANPNRPVFALVFSYDAPNTTSRMQETTTEGGGGKKYGDLLVFGVSHLATLAG